MPVYDYNCINGHWTEAFRSFERRDDCPVCDTCDAVTKRGWAIKPPPAPVETGPVVRYRNGDLRAQYRLVDLLCACGHRERETLVSPDVKQAPCPSCSAQADVVEHSGEKYIIGDELLKLCNAPGGYYDRGAGRIFYSKKDRSEWIKEGGWEEAGGSLDQTIDGMERRRDDARRRDAAEWKETLDRYNHHPDFRAYREGRDRGQFRHTNHKQ